MCWDLREVKDESEIKTLREGVRITNSILEEIFTLFEERKDLSEIDIAMFIESESRQRGAEGTGFPTIAAGPRRIIPARSTGLDA